MKLPPLMSDPSRAWTPFEPGPGHPWDLAKVAHLHRRAGFAAPWSTLQRDLAEGPEASVARLLDGGAVAGDGSTASEFEALAGTMAAQLAPEATLTRLQGIWLYRMIFTPHPLRERMTLFWHNHFATSHAKVKNSGLMQRQSDLLRAHALGDFKSLIAAIGRDPAMRIWLDSTENRKAHPNENYAREVMELFTLGRGHYTEKDIREAARAFTGGFVIRDRFVDVAAQHDDGVKTLLGHTGRFRGDDLPAILLAQPACAEFLCGKLARHFLTDVDPLPESLVAPLAEAFRASDYDIQVPVKAILRSTLFFDPAVRRRRVKSPVEFAIGTIRALEVLKPTVQAEALATACGRMGQNLYAPPSVAGWDGGPAWANSTTMLARANLVLGLLSNDDPAFGKRCDIKALAARYGASTPAEMSAFLVDLLVQDAFDRGLRGRVASKGANGAATLILTSPEYQLS